MSNGLVSTFRRSNRLYISKRPSPASAPVARHHRDDSLGCRQRKKAGCFRAADSTADVLGVAEHLDCDGIEGDDSLAVSLGRSLGGLPSRTIGTAAGLVDTG